VDPPTRPADVPVTGRCRRQFAPVRAEFLRNFVERGEVGAGLCVLIDGEPVVDLSGGWSDEARTSPWRPDTLVDVYSVGKAVVGVLALQLVDDGIIGLDEPVASLWPEFASGGKEAATVRHALCHRAGVPAVRIRLTDDDLWDFDAMTDAVAATEPWWEPGTRHAYHTNTYGHLIGGIIHRATGELPGTRLRPMADLLGADIFFGVPDDQQARCAEIIWALGGPPPVIDFDALSGDELMVQLSYFNPPGYSSMGVVNSPEWRAAQIPSTNSHATATGVARIYQGLLEPGRLLTPALLAEATSAQSVGFCPVLGEEVTFGLGFKPTTPRRPFGPNPNSFGHFGTGGAVGFADPDASIAFGYTMNHVIPRWQSSRNRSIIDALYRCL
jgi:CubicO group peptidase (beta-lactamase class C family)